MTNVAAYYLVWCGIQHLAEFLHWMPRHPTLVYLACCGIQTWMLRHPSLIFFFHFLPSPHAAASTVACCDMLLSYLFQCLGILSNMLLHPPFIFLLCCSIELLMLWHDLSLLILAQFWSVFALFDPYTWFITYKTK